MTGFMVWQNWCVLCKKAPTRGRSKYCSEACAHTAAKGRKALKAAKMEAALAAARRAVVR